MSLELSDVIHTRAEAFEALKLLAVRHGRSLNLGRVEGVADRSREQQNIALCDALIDLLVTMFGVSGAELRSPLRCRREVARVRQIGMYVAHTAFGLAMREVAAGFARDRTTVMHACHLVEDMRDDTEFDAIVSTFERIAQSAFTAWRLAA
ncbi:Chromosomal replication initiator DnaA domain protein [Brucella anthropi ATCC 49188]|uniref:Chromosomal replication initiator DnaA domain protein n=1 Tax=Brucella anthropi (strain ATCC 49188 / DSM 6882 / CCUG 24695 / JCM 21032 / LMG 3331 / NBRC 15819 / NCTC 12168 / Alc 37) TaxID=439375 RepID=A6X2E6_BRUA4|nr:Chromosomal replication initiator DnaA domain protein [Brucella anthropi ATCC 49188]SUA61476.1 Chromosomal replication initiator protein DnaA [Brucella anthropi]